MTAVMERVQQSALRLRRRVLPPALILVYHRVGRPKTDPWQMSVSPERFAEQLQVLRRQAHPMTLQELIQALGTGKIPRRSVVVTFDDGYADNLYEAKPLLEQYGIPGTFFVTTGYVAQQAASAQEFWWDELERIVMQPEQVPESLAIEINGGSYHWRLSPEPAGLSREELCRTLWELLHKVEDTKRQATLGALRQWAAVPSEARASHRPLTVEELLELSGSPLVEIGAHTVTHSALSGLPADVQGREIAGSKVALEELLGRRVTSFSYPFGRRGDYNQDVTSLVRDAGFLCACCNSAGVIERYADPFELHRLRLQELGGDEFARILSWWFDG
jgi:peptidoglycan/xylan/chitin deacetylase (PgdA/CDA1 family)